MDTETKTKRMRVIKRSEPRGEVKLNITLETSNYQNKGVRTVT